MHSRSAIAGGLLAVLSATAPGQTWTQLTPGTSPSVRRDGGMAYDLVNANLLLYGGLLTPTAIDGQTWSFDGSTWTQLSPATTPPPRWGHRCVLDSRRGRIVTFGGRSPTTLPSANDTWEWNGIDWQQVITAHAPSPRAFYSMAYDDRRAVCIVYGTQSGSPNGNQTWEYDGTDWTQVTTATVPPGLESPALVYDKARGVTVMFGGWNGLSPGVLYDTTWEYDGVDWTLRAPATVPTARYRSAFWYDDARGRVVVYGGFGNATALTDTWEYDGVDWTMVASTGPFKSTESYAGYDQTRRQAYHFGGSGPTGNSQETWIYAGASTALFAPFGRGCAGGAGTPALSANAPVLGQGFTLSVASLGSGALGALLLQGFSSTALAGTRLPLDLTPYGLSGCRLEIAPTANLFLFASNGTASLAFTVPNATALLDLAYFTQAIAPDATAANGVASMSNAGHAVLGN